MGRPALQRGLEHALEDGLGEVRLGAGPVPEGEVEGVAVGQDREPDQPMPGEEGFEPVRLDVEHDLSRCGDRGEGGLEGVVRDEG